MEQLNESKEIQKAKLEAIMQSIEKSKEYLEESVNKHKRIFKEESSSSASES